MRILYACLSLGLPLAAAAQPVAAPAPPSVLSAPTRLDPAWQQRSREMFKTAIEIPTVAGRGEMPRLAEYLAGQFRAAGWRDQDIEIIPHEGMEGDSTVTMIVRWPAARAARQPMLLLAHMDVVEARREDWQQDPFEFIERDGYFYGRGTLDNKQGVIGIAAALIKLRQSGFRPNRDLIAVFTGDEETAGNGATLAAERLKNAELALNFDVGGGSYTRDGRPLGYGLQTAEKTYRTYAFTATNRGGHSSRPRPDNAIYDLADGLKRLQTHRFEPMLNDTTRAYFTERAKQEGSNALGEAMRRWLANPEDGAAADLIEASELEVGMTRTRCVATRLDGGHADNALPQRATATVNCRIMPGIDPASVAAELQQVAGIQAKVTATDEPPWSAPSPLRSDVLNAYRAAVQAIHGPRMVIVPQMSTGATDGLFFRAAGVPVYGVSGEWIISPDDERAHGLDERIPVRAFYDNIVHVETMIRRLAR